MARAGMPGEGILEKEENRVERRHKRVEKERRQKREKRGG